MSDCEDYSEEIEEEIDKQESTYFSSDLGGKTMLPMNLDFNRMKFHVIVNSPRADAWLLLIK